ncbi:MAG: P1 family peptidase [Rhodospirillaceae bacterium]|jgi:L-aminopeptidase/D-esterase-like protein|nr:P1 family peptidase [Rhodospirillaceae bacterium]MBT4691221.1 P1 family peptidase [Rhodospirillaceae bacterium]MBT5082508.1 P1 family peptidase [Rhodospirillaceae bacterium]MBT5525383.1 P1 family peptidase [Rhodospirillaceae bacterium]MBT5880088.1 P1 family peptidase [Rhodospirillaceae bacterium]
MIKPGPRNLLTDVDGLMVGNAADSAARSGVTVVMAEDGAVASGDVRGAAPGTRETDLLDPTCMIERIDAVCLSGGSVYGLAAGDAVVRWLYDHERGFTYGSWRVPIVPGAIINDLGMGGEKNWGTCPAYDVLARAACDDLGEDFSLGNIGAGLGASAGPLKAGLGSASAVDEHGLQVAALVITNPFGATVIPGTGSLNAWVLERDGEMGQQHAPGAVSHGEDDVVADGHLGGNTTLAVVATNATLDKAQAKRVAMMAHDGMARAIRPIHTPFDGDVVFALSTTKIPLPAPGIRSVSHIGALAADCLTRAIGRSVYEADALGDFASYRESHSDAFADGSKTG